MKTSHSIISYASLFCVVFVLLIAAGCSNETQNKNQEPSTPNQENVEAMVDQLVKQKVDSALRADSVKRSKQVAAKAARENAQKENSAKTSEIYMFLTGRIGGDENSQISLEGRTGSYTFLNYSRDVKVDEYNEQTGHLVISGYERGTGKYIGRFDGMLKQYKDGGHYYQGKFTNYKGVSLTFSLDAIED